MDQGKRVGAAIAAFLAVVVSGLLAFGETAEDPAFAFGGFFEATVETTQTAALTVKGIGFNSVLTLEGWSASVDAQFSDTSLDTLRFATSGALGEIGLNSALTFNPSTVSFLSWQSGASFTLLDLSFSDVLYVTTPQTQSYNQLSISGAFGDRTYRLKTKFGICPLTFWEATACIDWPWEDCETSLSGCVSISDVGGFDAFDLTMADLVLFENLLGMEWSLSVALSYTLEEKTLSPTLKLIPDWFLCTDIELLGEVSAGPSIASVDAILIYGIVGECEITEGISVRFADSLAAGKNAAVTGKADYFEMIGVSGPLPACCGSVGSFDAAGYFDSTSNALFDLGLVVASFDTQIASNFAFSFDAEIPTDGVGWKLVWNLRVIW